MIEETELGLDEISLESMIEGAILKDIKIEAIARKELNLLIKKAKDIKQEVIELYKTKKEVKDKDIIKIIEKHADKHQLIIEDYIDRLSGKTFFKIENRQELLNGSIIVKFKPVDMKEREELITKIAKKLADKLPKKIVIDLLKDAVSEGFKEETELEELDKKLDKKKPKIRSRLGCFNIIIDDETRIRLR